MATKISKSAKATSKPQKSSKPAKAIKAAPKAKAPQKAAGKPSEAYRSGSLYQAVTDVLLGIGIGKTAKLAEIEKRLQKWEGYKAFKSREPRNDNAKKPTGDNGKVRQTLDVLRRADYGSPLRATKHEIRRDPETGEYGIFRM